MIDILKKIKKKDLNFKLFESIIEHDINNNGSILNRYLIDDKFKNYFDNLVLIDKCKWFNDEEKKISLILPLHDIDYTNNNKNNFFGDIIHYKSKILQTNNKFNVIKPKEQIINKEEEYKKLQIKIEKLKNDNKKESSIKSTITKSTKKIENLDKITKTYSYEIYPNIKQIEIIHKWFN